MEQGGWQTPWRPPVEPVHHDHDPLGYLLLPLLGYVLICVAIVAVLLREIGVIVPW